MQFLGQGLNLGYRLLGDLVVAVIQDIGYGRDTDISGLDIAQAANVSIATVSNVLNDLVVAVIQDIGYGRDTDISGLGNVF